MKIYTQHPFRVKVGDKVAHWKAGMDTSNFQVVSAVRFIPDPGADCELVRHGTMECTVPGGFYNFAFNGYTVYDIMAITLE